MSDKLFNQVLVLTGLLVVSGLYAAAWILNKPLDLQGLFIYALPALLHAINSWKDTQLATKSVEKDTAVTVATIQAGSATTNGLTTH